MTPNNSVPVVNLNLSSFENGTSSNLNNNNENLSQFKDYIILNNIALKKDNDELLKQLKKKDKKILDLESETDKQDERIRYMRGLLHNLYELKTLSAKSSDIWKSNSKKLSNEAISYGELENYLNKIIFIFSIFQIINLLTILMFLKNNKIYFIVSNFLPLIIMKIFIKKLIFLNFNQNNYKNNLDNSKELDSKIIELEQACAGVSVMIDNI